MSCFVNQTEQESHLKTISTTAVIRATTKEEELKLDTPQCQKLELQNINARLTNIFDFIDAVLSTHSSIEDQYQKKFDALKNEIDQNFNNGLNKWIKENNELHETNCGLLNQ